MSHILLDILFVAVGVLIIVICAKRGFFLTLLKFFKLFLAFGAAYLWGGAFGNFLGEKFLNAPIRSSVFGKVNEIYLNTAGSFDVESAMEAVPDFLLTDSLRALKLEAEGYKVSVVEYISPLDTPKNLLIRAMRTGQENTRARQEYDAVRRMLGTTSELDRRCMELENEFFVTDEDLMQ